MMTRILFRIAAPGIILIWLAASVFLSEGALRIPRSFRTVPDATDAVAHITRPDGVKLFAWSQQPPQAVPWNGRAVILLHGVADSHRGMRGVASMLARNGYRVLSPDSRGHGASEGDALISYGLREREDLRQWVDWIEQAWKPSAVYGLGASMGASILLQALPTEPRLTAAVAEAPFASFRAVAYHRVRQAGTLFFAPSVEPALAYTRLRYGLDLAEASPESAIRNASQPVLLIHGSEDRNIPPEHSARVMAARPQNTQLWTVPGGHHVDAFGVAKEEYEYRVLAFFEKRALLPQALPASTPSATTSRRP